MPRVSHRTWMIAWSLCALAVAFAAAAMGRLAPVVGRPALARALSAPDPPVHYEDDGIRFLERRLRGSRGSDPSARVRLVDLYLSRAGTSGARADLEMARVHLDTLFLRDSADASLHVRLSALHLAFHRFAPSLAAARRAMELSGPDGSGDAALSLFDALLARGKRAEASETLRRISNGQETLAILIRQVQLLEREGDIEGALRKLAKAVSRAEAYAQPPPTLAWCLVARAGLRARLGLGRLAAADYQLALEKVPGYPPALEGLGRLAHVLDGDRHAAGRLYRASLARGGPASLMLDLMELDRAEGRLPEAGAWKSEFLASALRSPETERLHYRPLARLLLDSPGTRAQALRYARLDAQERPTAESLDLLAWALYLNGSVSAGYAESLKALAAGKDNPEILYHGALIAWHAYRRDEARSLMSRATRLLRASGAYRAPHPWSRQAAGKGPGAIPDEALLLHAHSH